MKKQQDLIGQITSNLADTTKALFSVIGTVRSFRPYALYTVLIHLKGYYKRCGDNGW